MSNYLYSYCRKCGNLTQTNNIPNHTPFSVSVHNPETCAQMDICDHFWNEVKIMEIESLNGNLSLIMRPEVSLMFPWIHLYSYITTDESPARHNFACLFFLVIITELVYRLQILLFLTNLYNYYKKCSWIRMFDLLLYILLLQSLQSYKSH